MMANWPMMVLKHLSVVCYNDAPPPVQDVPGGAGQHPGHRGHGRLGAQDRGPAGGQDGGAGDQSEGGVWSRDPAVSCYWPGRGGRLGPGAAA